MQTAFWIGSEKPSGKGERVVWLVVWLLIDPFRCLRLLEMESVAVSLPAAKSCD